VLVIRVTINGAADSSERAQQTGRRQTSEPCQTGRGLDGVDVWDCRWRPCLDWNAGFGSAQIRFGRAACWRTRAGFELGLCIPGHQLALALRGWFCLDARRLGCGVEPGQFLVGLDTGGFWRPDLRRLSSLGRCGRRGGRLCGLGSARLLDQAGDSGVAGHPLKSKKKPWVQHTTRRGGQFANRRPTGQLGNRGRSVFVV